MFLIYKILILVFFGISVFLISMALFFREKRGSTVEKESFIIKIGKKVIPSRIVEKESKEIEKMLRFIQDKRQPEEIIVQKFIFSIIFAIVGLIIFKNIIFAILIGILGFYLPVMTLKEKVKKKRDAIYLELPNIIDLLTLLVEGGMDFSMALNKIVERSSSSPLIEEFKRFLQDLRLGKTRVQALKSLDKRIEQDDLSEVCTALVQATVMGSNLGPVLRVQSELMRARRFLYAEQKAQAATIKILFPIMIFILPAVFIVIFGPVAMQIMGTGLF